MNKMGHHLIGHEGRKVYIVNTQLSLVSAVERGKAGSD